ncbi:MAG: YeiH family protein [Opitutales bacterium]
MSADAPVWKTPALWLAAAACALPWVTPPEALFGGLVFATLVGPVDRTRAAKAQKFLLQASVVGLGFGIRFAAVVKAGSTGLAATAGALVATLALGLLLARLFRVEKTTGRLIATGTAICGGSAIAALGPVLGAEAGAMSVSLGCVFVLNAVALFVFPAIGHWAALTPVQFGWWAAIAIHDTSSVVGAAARYSAESLAVAVPVKLARALWILPLAAGAAVLVRRPGGKASIPWFIFLFIGASALVSSFPAGEPAYGLLVQAAKAGLAVTLFLIGAGLSPAALRSVGWRPFAQGIVLWLVVMIVTLLVVRRMPV